MPSRPGHGHFDGPDDAGPDEAVGYEADLPSKGPLSWPNQSADTQTAWGHPLMVRGPGPRPGVRPAAAVSTRRQFFEEATLFMTASS